MTLRPTFERELAHTRAIGDVIFPAGAFGHLLAMPFFFIWDVPWLGWLRLASVLCWGGAALLNRRGHLLMALFVAEAEVVMTASATTLTLGVEPGFYLQLLPMALGGSIFPQLYGRITKAATAVGVSVIVGLLVWGALSEPPHHLSSTWNDIVFASNLSTIFGMLWLMFRSVTTSTLEAEVRSDRLLHNVLPPRIAERLKKDPGVIADRFDEATVLFADIVGFTPLSAQMDPVELVGFLDELFREIDALVAEHGLEKIKTIGDAYMVASGIPEPREDHVERMARFALGLVSAVENRARARGIAVRLRAGIQTGPVVAGVIGQHKFIYDLWGDTVNTAARMESHGEPGRVQVTRAVRDALGDAFSFEPRGEIEVKGKGVMETFWLVGEV